MSNSPIDFDDISLIRGMSALGESCKKKFINLVKPIKNILEKLEERKGNVKDIEKEPYNVQRFSVSCPLAKQSSGEKPSIPPTIFAGINFKSSFRDVMVWIETPPGNPAKADIAKSIESCRQNLRDQTAWTITGPEGWFDIYRAVPLEKLLIESDQSTWIEEFVNESLADLRAAGILEAVANTASKHANIK